MSSKYKRQLAYLSSMIFTVLLACGTSSIPALQPKYTAPATETLHAAQSIMTEYARQAEGTRQVLADTEIALSQNNNATATVRSLDATATFIAPLPSVNEQVEIQSNVMWQDTGIHVRVGNFVQIQYITGQWTTWIDTDPLTNGMGQFGREEICRIMPESNLGGLIGRVAESPPFFIGNGTAFYSEYNGTLQLSINDCPEFDNNAGSLTISVIIDR